MHISNEDEINYLLRHLSHILIQTEFFTLSFQDLFVIRITRKVKKYRN